MNARLRILLVITGLDYGGAETQAVRMARGLASRGHTVDVVSMMAPRAFELELQRAGVGVHTLGMLQGKPSVRALARYVRLVHAFCPDVIHAHMVHANLLARLARPLAPVPAVLSTAHSLHEGGRAREYAYRMTDWLGDLTTHVSERGLDRYIRIGAVPASRGVAIPNGVDLERFRPDAAVRAAVRAELGLEGSFAWLAVGRFEKVKDYPTLLSAFAAHSARHPSSKLLIAGQGPLRAEAEAASAAAPVGSVRFLGLREDIPSLMASADAFALSSRWEGLPMVLLEAAATGLPSVATDVGGCAEAVQHGRTGFLVPPSTPAALAEAMGRMTSLPAHDRATMGEAAREYVTSRYGLETQLTRWEGVYHTIAQKGHRRLGCRYPPLR